MILIGAFILSVIPGLGFYFWLKRKDPENRAYTACCTGSTTSRCRPSWKNSAI